MKNLKPEKHSPLETLETWQHWKILLRDCQWVSKIWWSFCWRKGYWNKWKYIDFWCSIIL